MDAKDLPVPSKCPICNGVWSSHRNRIQMCSRYHDGLKQIEDLHSHAEALADIADELDKNTSNYFSYESRDAIIKEAHIRANKGETT